MLHLLEVFSYLFSSYYYSMSDSLVSVVRQMSPTPVAKGLSIGKRWLQRWVRCGVVSPPSFTDNRNGRYFD